MQDSKRIPEHIEKQLLSVETLPVESLIIDRAYQRDEKPRGIAKMVKDWNWLACGLLVVSLRSGERSSYYAVIDGQQRLTAIKQLGFIEAPCRIYVDLTQEQEAELYELLNASQKPGFNDLFKSRLLRNESKAHAIDLAVEQVGYHLDPERRHSGERSNNTHFYIQTMTELERIYDLGGVNLIMETLKFIKSVWAPDHLPNQQMVIAGVSTFLKRYPAAQMTELKNKLKKEGLNKTIQNAIQFMAVHGKGTGGNNRGLAFAESMLISYNHNRQEANRIKSKAW